jgi:hypothetical protein
MLYRTAFNHLQVSPAVPHAHPQLLYYGSAATPLVRVMPDIDFPNMWRMIRPDGQISDLANLARVKDAALALCERGPPARNPQRLHWRIDRSNSLSGARTRVRRVGPDPKAIPAAKANGVGSLQLVM